MYTRILLAYDGTREGAIALREGALLAKQGGAKVFLLSVLPETEGVLMTEGVYGDVVGRQMDESRGILERGRRDVEAYGRRCGCKAGGW